ncbi:sigma 54-interacting transcriptional regulator [Myxococcota bacterium]|nr:sigma 54-interacting transcriptional regulator [Myxococcota bacterium]
MAWLEFARDGAVLLRHRAVGEVTIGRGSGCDVRLGEPEISREHVAVARRGGAYWLLGLRGAATGADGRPLPDHALRDGERFRVGPWEVRFVAGDPPDGAATTERPAREPPPDGGAHPPPGLVGHSPAMQRIFRQVRRAARSDLPVLVLGETGTGKERIAGALHALSPRAAGPLVALNCAAVSALLFESELFGHRRGAFTGALADHAGAFERAATGTLFLDEVGELPPDAQAKLLRVLETGEVLPVGASRPVRTSARLVAATNRDLAAEQRAGRFRGDLRYRLWVVAIELPPLRERREDIPLLCEALLPAATPGRRWRLTPAALTRLVRHDWPGNVRELRNTLLRATLHADGALIDAPDLEFLPEALPRPAEPEPTGPSRLDEAESRAIVAALRAFGGNRTRAARHLGIARSTLHLKLRALGAEDPGEWERRKGA